MCEVLAVAKKRRVRKINNWPGFSWWENIVFGGVYQGVGGGGRISGYGFQYELQVSGR
jgi:hypothetical protein